MGEVLARAFQEGGVIMYLIAIVGGLSVALVISRLMAIKNLVIDRKEFIDNIAPLIIGGNMRQAIAFCDSRQAPLTTVVKAGLVQALNKRPDEEIQVAMDAAVLRETPKIEGWTSFLAVFGNIGVLIGLLGTIMGMIQSFRAVGEEADPSAKAALLSQGISHALNCTAFGLLVAILAIVAFGYFQLRIQRAESEMIESSMTIMNLVASNREKMRE